MTMLCVVLCLLSLFVSSVKTEEPFAAQLVPALYVFGDSTVDGGNRPPSPSIYGIDLHSSSIPRRWTNGKTIADFIATLLGLPIVPPYHNISQAGISTTGVNYGFPSCGILPDTCSWVPGWSFDNQIARFNSTVTMNLTNIFNQRGLFQHLADSIFLVSFGINDYVQYYLPGSNSATLNKLEPDVFAKYLLNEMASRLRTLYDFGARRFLVNNIWPLGCTTRFENQTDPLAICCNETINAMLLPFSNGLPIMLKNLQSDLPGFLFSNSNDFAFVRDLKENTAKYGIVNTTGECWYNDTMPVCQNRDLYLYVDFVHTTQAANKVFSLNCFNGTLCSPLNIFHLAAAQVH